MHYPLPKRTVPTVKQGTAEGGKWWYRVFLSATDPKLWGAARFVSKDDALQGRNFCGYNWLTEDQPIVAHLLSLPLTEEVEDAGDE